MLSEVVPLDPDAVEPAWTPPAVQTAAGLSPRAHLMLIS